MMHRNEPINNLIFSHSMKLNLNESFHTGLVQQIFPPEERLEARATPSGFFCCNLVQCCDIKGD